MREEIEKILNDESFTTNEERVDAITKGLATLVIPKDKYNDVSNRLKTTESNYENLQNEFDSFKKSKMTDDEKAIEEKKKFEQRVRENNIARSELAVKGLLLDNGIKVTDDDVELKNTLENIISEDLDKSINLANSFISLLNKTKENTVKETTTQLLNDTPKPIGGVESSANVDKIEELNKELANAIEKKDVVKQTQILNKIFIENQKKKTNI